MNLSIEQEQSHGHEKRFLIAKGERAYVGDGLGAWDEQMKTGIYRINKQQGATA